MLLDKITVAADQDGGVRLHDARLRQPGQPGGPADPAADQRPTTSSSACRASTTQSDAAHADQRQHPRPAGFRPRRGDRRRRPPEFPALRPRHAMRVLDRPGTDAGSRRDARARRQHLRLGRDRRRGRVRDQGRRRISCGRARPGRPRPRPLRDQRRRLDDQRHRRATASTMLSTCSATSSGATTTTTRTATATRLPAPASTCSAAC